MTNEQKYELISAFLDGESVDESIVEGLLADEEVMKKWNEYTNIRATIRGELPSPSIDLTDFAEGVAKAIEKEPIYITTAPKLSVANDDIGVSDNEAKYNATKRFSVLFRSLGQIAIAASVACICVFGVQMYKNSSVNSITDFKEQSFMNANGISMSAVSNTAKPLPSMSLNNASLATAANVNSDHHAMDAEQLRRLEKQKTNELKTIDALINDHDMMKRTMIINN